MAKVKVGIIGTGSISHLHAMAYQKCPDAELYAACDINLERAKAFARKYGIDESRVFADADEMLKLKELDAVSVCTWNNAHADCSIKALRAGKDVLCEKPLAMNAEEAKTIQKTAEETEKLLMVGFVRRFGSNTQAVKEFIQNGDLGHIHYAKINSVRRWGNPGGWFADKKRSGGGPVIDLAVHVIDLVRYLTDRPKLLSVSASTFYDLGMMPGIRGVEKYYSNDYEEKNDVEDGATALLRFENDLTVLLEVSWTRFIKKDRSSVEFFGSKAGIMLDPVLEIFERRGDYITDVKPVLTHEGIDMDEIFGGEINHFVDCVKNGTDCICPVQDGVALMEILDAIYRSAQERKEITFSKE